jgi:hypothetical protein
MGFSFFRKNYKSYNETYYKGEIMENDIVVTSPGFVKVLGKTLLKSAAIAAGLTIGLNVAQTALGKVKNES